MLHLVPAPKQIKETGTGYLATPETVVAIGQCYQQALDIRKVMMKELGFSPRLEGGDAGDVTLCIRKGVEQSYQLTIAPTGVSIVGGDEAGLFYGVQTLCQLIRLCGAALPGLVIDDAPALNMRGYYFDVSRGRVPTLEEMKRIADRCSKYKINQIQFNMQHPFPYKGFEDAWFFADPIRPEEIMAFDQYCRERHIELVPSLACFGHLYHILDSYTHGHLCELEPKPGQPLRWFDRMSHHTVDVSQEESFRMVCDLIDQYVPLFTSNKVNITCDEPNDLGLGKSKQYVNEHGGRERVYVQFVNRIAKHVKDTYHREVQFWSDILVRKPEYLKDVDHELVCLHWDYREKPSREDAKAISDCGLSWVACPGTNAWNTFLPRMNIGSSNIRQMAQYASEYGARGLLMTDWGDFGHVNLTSLSMPGMIEGAAMGWNPKDLRDQAQMDEAISLAEYGASGLVSLLRSASACESTDWRAMCVIHDGENGAGEHTQENVKTLSAEQAKQNYNAILQKRRELLAMTHHMRNDARGEAAAMEVGMEGAALCEALIPIVQRKAYGMDTPDFIQKNELASHIERWFDRYALVWRSMSKESELWRLAEAIKQITLQLRMPN